MFKKLNLIELFLSGRVVENKRLGISYQVIYVPPKLLKKYASERRSWYVKTILLSSMG